jgi:hypothetical protein
LFSRRSNTQLAGAKRLVEQSVKVPGTITALKNEGRVEAVIPPYCKIRIAHGRKTELITFMLEDVKNERKTTRQ